MANVPYIGAWYKNAKSSDRLGVEPTKTWGLSSFIKVTGLDPSALFVAGRIQVTAYHCTIGSNP